MKIKINKTAATKAFYTFIAVCASIVFYFFVLNFGYFTDKLSNFIRIINPFLWGFAVAYILARPLGRIEYFIGRYFLPSENHAKAKRAISIVIILAIVLIFLGLLSSFVLPQLLSSAKGLSSNLPGYIHGLQNMIDELLAQTDFGNTLNQMIAPAWDKILNTTASLFGQLVPLLLDISVSLTSKLFNLVLIFVVCIYAMYHKEHFGKSILRIMNAFLPKKAINNTLFVLHLIDDTFGNYISGQLIDALVVGALCCFGMSILNLPYALLVGVIVACTNVIPMIGPFIGAVPSAFIILMAGRPMQALTFVIFIVVLQQIDGNILVPRIVGSSTGLSGFWVLFSILLGGSLFGILGIALCVPTLSVLFKLFNLLVEYQLEKKRQMPHGPESE